MVREITLKLYFMKCSERKISQCILPFIDACNNRVDSNHSWAARFFNTFLILNGKCLIWAWWNSNKFFQNESYGIDDLREVIIKRIEAYLLHILSLLFFLSLFLFHLFFNFNVNGLVSAKGTCNAWDESLSSKNIIQCLLCFPPIHLKFSILNVFDAEIIKCFGSDFGYSCIGTLLQQCISCISVWYYKWL